MTQASFVQHGMWMADRESGAAAYHMPLILHLGDGVDVGALSKACAALVDRHALLAAALADRDGAASLVPAETAPGLRIAGAGERIEEEIARAFDLGRGPLIRFALFGGDLVVTAHHAVFDGHSKDVLVRDLAALREGTKLGLLPPNRLRAARRGRALAGRARSPRGARVLAAALERAGAGDRPRRGARLAPGRSRRGHRVRAAEARCRRADHVRGDDGGAARPAVLVRQQPGGHRDRPVHPDAGDRRPDRAVRQRAAARLRALGRPRLPAVRHSGCAPSCGRCTGSARCRSPARSPGSGRTPRWPRSASATASAPTARVDDVEWLVFNGAVRGDLQLQLVDTGDELVSSLRYSAQAAHVAPRLVDDLAHVLLAVTQNPDERLADLLTLERAKHVEAPQAGPPGGVSAAEPTAEPAGELVEAVREIWQEVLGIERIELHDDLFELGGHSLTITRIIALMQERLGVDVPLDDLFDNPTIVGALDAAGLR